MTTIDFLSTVESSDSLPKYRTKLQKDLNHIFKGSQSELDEQGTNEISYLTNLLSNSGYSRVKRTQAAENYLSAKSKLMSAKTLEVASKILSRYETHLKGGISSSLIEKISELEYLTESDDPRAERLREKIDSSIRANTAYKKISNISQTYFSPKPQPISIQDPANPEEPVEPAKIPSGEFPSPEPVVEPHDSHEAFTEHYDEETVSPPGEEPPTNLPTDRAYGEPGNPNRWGNLWNRVKGALAVTATATSLALGGLWYSTASQNNNQDLGFYKAKVAQLQREANTIPNLSSRVIALTNERDTLKKDTEDYALKLTSLATERDSLASDKKTLAENNSNYEKTIASLSNRLTSTSTEKDSLQKQYTTEHNNLIKAQKSLKNTQADNSNLKKHNSDLEKKLAEYNTFKKALDDSRIREEKAKINDDKSKIAESLAKLKENEENNTLTLLSNPAFLNLKSEMAYMVIDEKGGTSITTLQFSPNNIKNFADLRAVADRFSQAYAPSELNPNAFNQFASAMGISADEAEKIEQSSNSKVATNLDKFIQFIFNKGPSVRVEDGYTYVTGSMDDIKTIMEKTK